MEKCFRFDPAEVLEIVKEDVAAREELDVDIVDAEFDDENCIVVSWRE